MRHLYPVSILLYLALVNRLYVLTTRHLHTNWLYNESPLTYYYKNTQKIYRNDQFKHATNKRSQ